MAESIISLSEQAKARLQFASVMTVFLLLLGAIPFPESDAWIFLLVGRFHPLVVHMPIGFIFALCLLEAFGHLTGKKLKMAKFVILWGTVFTSLGAVVIGTFLAIPGGYDSSLLFNHRWLGIGMAIASCWLIFLHELNWRWMRQGYRVVLGATFLLLSGAGHFGGSLTHGEDYLTAYLPAFLGGAYQKIDGGTVEDAAIFAATVQPIINAKCISCHSPGKSKGELMMHDLASLFEGGKEGPTLEAGDASASLMIRRAHLPLSDKKHMPPKGKPQLTDEELEVLSWWIDQGARERQPIEDLPSDGAITLLENALGFPVRIPKLPMEAWESVLSQVEKIGGQDGLRLRRIAQGFAGIDVVVEPSVENADQMLTTLLPLKANVISLSLGRTNLTDEGLKLVAEFTNLEELHVQETQISDTGVTTLSALRSLTEINLFGTSVTDAIFETLLSLPNLVQVVVWNTSVTEEATAEYLAGVSNPQKEQKIKAKIQELKSELDGLKVDVIGLKKSETLTGNSEDVVEYIDFEKDTQRFGKQLSSRAKVTISSSSEYDLAETHGELVQDKPNSLEFAFHTKEEKNPWVRLTFENEIMLNGVDIHNRRSHLDRSKGLQLESSQDGKNWQVLWKSDKSTVRWTVDLTESDQKQRKAKYFRFFIASDRVVPMHLKQVHFWGSE